MRWIYVLMFAVSVCSCGADSSEIGGVGGAGEDDPGACLGNEDVAVYESEGGGNLDAGVCSVAEGLADCVTGAEGCLPETLAVVGADGKDLALNEDLARCIETCTGNAFPLSPGCLSCYGDTIICSAASCATPCAPDPLGESCNRCRRENGCLEAFFECSEVGCDPFAGL